MSNIATSDLSGVRVLVLDGETRSALAVVRSLGAQGYDVAVASSNQRAISFSSKFASLCFSCPDPSQYPDRYAHWLSRTIELWHPRVLLPVTDLSLSLVLEFEQSFRETSVIPTVGRQTFDAVSDKAKLSSVAQSLGIATPKSVVLASGEYNSQQLAESVLSGFNYPLVVKPKSSVQRKGSSAISPEVFYANSADKVAEILSDEADNYQTSIEYLVQEKVEGSGVGVFALCLNGELITTFAHQRLLEKPPSGGRSVLSRSLAPELAPIDQAAALLKYFNWSGVAMVEFKQAVDGRFVLMEINPRFWGSLQLAIDAGRDFPAYLLKMSCAAANDKSVLEELRRLPPYKTDVALRWILGNLDHVYIRFRSAPIATLRDVFAANSLRFFSFSFKTRFEVCRISDIMPFFREIQLYFLSLICRDG